MDQPHILTRIKMTTERIGQLKYSIAMLRINIAGLKERLGIYPCTRPQLVQVSCDYYDYSDSGTDSDSNKLLSPWD